MVLTNISGPVPTFSFGGKNIKSLMFFSGGHGSMTTIVSIFSINGVIKMGMMSDKVHVPDAQQF
eukprot:CAMPEP_0170545466 /NCGR_PEP_ID=MMETSP0211-20121228/3864_1 /TAXON_ID=311385 /ORGANISM="Pseudokeronopsis sp., Strain OXSARD2" /LENGTH=63 /DNA_ID=CAMNT_0010849397 /DNA_START=594 /DNA_END=782 /DNA_ORIENTATION=-